MKISEPLSLTLNELALPFQEMLVGQSGGESDPSESMDSIASPSSAPNIAVEVTMELNGTSPSSWQDIRAPSLSACIPYLQSMQDPAGVKRSNCPLNPWAPAFTIVIPASMR